MPNRWFHEAIDVIVWGKSYWRLHRDKDSAAAKLGPKHRTVGHSWYRVFGKDWSFEAPFPQRILNKTRRLQLSRGPEAAEAFQAGLTHDYVDRIWDTLAEAERCRAAEAVRRVILSPEHLREWAGVDVTKGLIKRTYGPSDGCLFPIDTWEREASLPTDYKKLRAYVEAKPIRDLI